MVEASDRVALLRQGISVVEAEPGRVGVTGADTDRVVEAVTRRLGDDVDVEVLGELPRRLAARRCVGHMEREAGRLQLRYVLGREEHIDEIVVVEDERTVVVLATVCTPVTDHTGDRYEGPWHVYLERALGGRAVIDGAYGDVVPYKNVYETIALRTRSRPPG